MSRATRNSCIKTAIQTSFCTLLLIKFLNTGFDKSFIFSNLNDKQGGVCYHTLLCDYNELFKDLLHFFFQPVHASVIRLYDRQAFNSDRRYYERVQETGTYLDTVAASTDQAEPKTVQDFLDHIENQELYHVLITVDRLTLQIVLMKIQGYSTRS